MIQSLLKESDRGCVILGAAMLDELLEELLTSFCRQAPQDVKSSVKPLFRGFAPLSTFSARIQVAYALGILPNHVRDDLEIIRRIRNDCAHDWEQLDFSEPRFAQRLDAFFKKPLYSSQEKREVDRGQIAMPGVTREQLFTRIMFVAVAHKIVGTLGFLIEEALKGHDIRKHVQRLEQQHEEDSARPSDP